jgi:tripartite-type tricarboxylate transporter receptor subunit TctC
MGPPKLSKEVVAVLAPAIEKAIKDPAFVQFVNERNARWEYIPPGEVIKKFDERREIVRAIMSKADILKGTK